MKRRNKINRISIAWLIALMIACTALLPVAGLSSRAEASGKDTDEPVTYEELKGKRVGMQTGTILDKLLPEHIEDVQLVYYDEISDLHNALTIGKVAAITADEPTLRYMAAEDPQVFYRKEVYEKMDYGFILNKGNTALCEELNDFIAESKEDGLIDEMTTDWFDNANADRKMPDYDSLPAKKGTINLAVDPQIAPFVFVRDGKHVGFEVELMARFCKEQGYALKIDAMNFGALIPAVSGGKYDVGAACITITEERKKSVLFTDPTYAGGATIAVKGDPSQAQTARPKIRDFAKKKIAVLTGSNFPDLVAANLPDAEQVFFNTIADNAQALKADKVAALAVDEPVARNLIAENEEFMIADGYLDEFDFAFVYAKNDRGKELCDDMSAFMRGMNEDGTMKELQKKWFDAVPEESLMSLDPAQLPAKNGVIKVATLQYPPFNMQGEKGAFGYEPELIAMYAKEKGYGVEFSEMNADAIIPAVQSGKCDLGAAATAITEERKEQVYFSEPEYSGGVVLVTKKQAADGKAPSVWSRIRESFKKTFVRENRYRLFLQGVGVTILISVLSALLGTALGFLTFMSCRRGNVIANKIAAAYQWLMEGIPMVVLLMILYYIVFGKTSISGMVISIVGFALVFGAEVFGMLMTAVSAVDPGQMEAAYALGYTDRKAFFTHILPQAMPHFMPGYRGSLVSLIKATSIVGYVAVEDLTKRGDIVRSRTYEAFFPLIAVAVIYFILGGLLVFATNRLTLRLDPTRRSEEDILKGIEIRK